MFGRIIGRSGSTFIILFGMLINLIISILLFFEIGFSSTSNKIYFFEWLNLSLLTINICFFFDIVTSTMLFVVIFISFFVHLYSVEYMSYDPSYPRFLSYLSLFTFFMIFLVVSDNYLQMFIGREGVGLSSYLLISFWYTRILANKAAIKAMLVNRIGDLSLLTAMAVIFTLFGSLNYNIIFVTTQYIVDLNYIFLNIYFNSITLICLLLFIGAMGKSAQIGLHVWLPDAMEGPTPVSALIHAATMVTAGVFLVIRSSFLFEYSTSILLFVSFIGGITALFSSMIGAFQFDIKKIVAYSTCSQLGYMFFSAGLSIYTISLFHLFNHAFFKALLFLSMGSIIHGLMDEQDFRKMGGLAFMFPLTYICVLVGSISLMAVPYLTGFFSKDFILELSFAFFNVMSIFIYFIGTFAAFLTAFYSTRLLYWIFLSNINSYKPYVYDIYEPGFFMSFTLLILSIFSIFAGYCFSEAFGGIGSNFWSNSIYINSLNFSGFEAEFELFFIKLLPLIISILGVIIYLSFIQDELYYFLFNSIFFVKVHFFFNKAMLFDNIYNHLLFKYILFHSYLSFYKNLEKGFFEFFGPLYVSNFLFRIWKAIGQFNTGLVYNYVFNMIFIMTIFIVFFEFIVWLDISIIINLIFGHQLLNWISKKK